MNVLGIQFLDLLKDHILAAAIWFKLVIKLSITMNSAFSYFPDTWSLWNLKTAKISVKILNSLSKLSTFSHHICGNISSGWGCSILAAFGRLKHIVLITCYFDKILLILILNLFLLLLLCVFIIGFVLVKSCGYLL